MNTPSVEPSVRSRLLPRFSFRVIFALVTTAALVSWCVRQAWAGNQLMMAVVWTLLFVGGVAAGSAVLFLIAWVPAWFGRDRWAGVNRGNPFAENQLPPQIMPPRKPLQ